MSANQIWLVIPWAPILAMMIETSCLLSVSRKQPKSVSARAASNACQRTFVVVLSCLRQVKDENPWRSVCVYVKALQAQFAVSILVRFFVHRSRSACSTIPCTF